MWIRLLLLLSFFAASVAYSAPTLLPYTVVGGVLAENKRFAIEHLIFDKTNEMVVETNLPQNQSNLVKANDYKLSASLAIDNTFGLDSNVQNLTNFGINIYQAQIQFSGSILENLKAYFLVDLARTPPLDVTYSMKHAYMDWALNENITVSSGLLMSIFGIAPLSGDFQPKSDFGAKIAIITDAIYLGIQTLFNNRTFLPELSFSSKDIYNTLNTQFNFYFKPSAGFNFGFAINYDEFIQTNITLSQVKKRQIGGEIYLKINEKYIQNFNMTIDLITMFDDVGVSNTIGYYLYSHIQYSFGFLTPFASFYIYDKDISAMLSNDNQQAVELGFKLALNKDRSATFSPFVSIPLQYNTFNQWSIMEYILSLRLAYQIDTTFGKWLVQ